MNPDEPLALGKLPSALLSRLVNEYAVSDPSVLVGPGLGRDAAAIKVGSATLVVKTDPITFATDHAPLYLVDVNANDVACLGAVPRWLVVTALLPAGATTPAMVEQQFSELRDICAARGIALVGCHTEVTAAVTRPVLVGTLLGEVSEGRLLVPGGGRPGDRLLVTKGIAIEGTALLARELTEPLATVLGKDMVEEAARLLEHPGISVVKDAAILLDAGGITALHDPTEGGLVTGVREMAEAAGYGATLVATRVPVLEPTVAITRHLGLDPLGLLSSGCLLAAAEPGDVSAILAAGAAAGITVTECGMLTHPEEGFVLHHDSPGPMPTFSSDEVTRVLQGGYV